MTTLTKDNDASDFELRELWRRYGQNDTVARERLVLHYAPLVKLIAGRLHSRLPSHVDEADLISSGLMGLLGAIERYDPELGVKFEGYAQTRIQGAMFDALRSLDWVPRRVRDNARECERVESGLRTKLGRPPSEFELADGLDIDVDELRRDLLEIADSRLHSFDAPVSANSADSSGGAGALHDFVSSARFNPQEDLDANESADDLRTTLADAIGELPERQQFIIACRYRDDLRLGEIGEVMHVSESRVSQLHTKALISLRAAIGVAGGRGEDLHFPYSLN